MSTNRKRERPADILPDHGHLDDLLDQALAQSFPASDPVAIDFASPGDRVTTEKCAK